jgi:hypothetical protein
MAGTGKTTIAYSLCEMLDKEGKLAACFFCSRQLSTHSLSDCHFWNEEPCKQVPMLGHHSIGVMNGNVATTKRKVLIAYDLRLALSSTRRRKHRHLWVRIYNPRVKQAPGSNPEQTLCQAVVDG